MLTIPPAAKVYLAASPVDFRKHGKGIGIGKGSRPFPPTPPGIRVRTMAVH
jgi:hypothetical protein